MWEWLDSHKESVALVENMVWPLFNKGYENVWGNYVVRLGGDYSTPLTHRLAVFPLIFFFFFFTV